MQAKHAVQRLWEASSDLLFPPVCTGCGRPGSEWCPSCESSLRLIEGPLCYSCGEPLTGGLRGACLPCTRAPLPLIVRSYADYRGPLARALVHLKYRPNRRLAKIMGDWLAGLYRRERWDVSLVVPVALSPRRVLQRGYNQTSYIAAGMAEGAGLRVAPKALLRTRETRSQVGLDAESRRMNVRGAFEAVPERVKDSAVLLVDDLFTTGATLTACAVALLDAGAHEVYGLTVGRARRDSSISQRTGSVNHDR